MTKGEKVGYWFLIAVSLIETVLLGLWAFADYTLGRLFHANQVYIWSYWSHVVADILISTLGLLTLFVTLLRNRRAKQIAIFFFLATIIFTSVNVVSSQPPDWLLELSYCVLPAVALIYLVWVWPRADYLRMSEKS